MTPFGANAVLIVLVAWCVYFLTVMSQPIPFDSMVMPYRIHIQTATRGELELLPGIGPKMAKRIIVYRQNHVVREPEDLLGVHGIGQRTVDHLRRYVDQEERE